MTTNEYIQGVKQHGWQRFNGRVWQRNYYEHIIRNEASYLKITEYVQTNPLKWREDTYHV
jgi:REP element-mobilizing transposase RayT